MHEPSAPVSETGSKIFLSRLKHETANAHRMLESARHSINLMHPAVTLHQYRAWLNMMLPVVAFTEKVIFPLTAPFIYDLEERKKYPKLINDLRLLGNPMTLNEVPAVREWHNILPNSTQAMAHLYIMEGSTLGGNIISKHISGVLGLNAANGAGYINCYAGKTGQMWKTFLDAFTSYVVSNCVEDEIIKEANWVFSTLYSHFESSTR